MSMQLKSAWKPVAKTTMVLGLAAILAFSGCKKDNFDDIKIKPKKEDTTTYWKGSDKIKKTVFIIGGKSKKEPMADTITHAPYKQMDTTVVAKSSSK
jgi:hypothetical protein